MSITASNQRVREVIHQVVNDPGYQQVSHVPLFAWQQIGLIAFSYAMVLGGMAIHLFADAALWMVYPFMIFGFYASFTPLHDATHRAVSSNKFLNDLLGTVSGTLLFPFVTTGVYRFLHLAHHRYVGDEDLDPDDAMVVIPTRYFPFGYLVLLFPDFLWVNWLFNKAWKRTPVRTRWATAAMFSGVLVWNVAWFASPLWYEYLVLFFIPNRLGILYVAYSFAHIQHPEGLKWNEFPFQTTFRLKGNRWFLKSFFGQAHHAIHHFLPHIPWYKYYQSWDLANGALAEEQIPVRRAFERLPHDFADRMLEQERSRPQELKVRVDSVEEVAAGVKSLVLSSVDGMLPSFSAGSHITLELPSGLKRSYSLLNPPFESDRYQIAVKLDPNSRGGSKEVHEALTPGVELSISPPRNNFLLYEKARRYILISGGIGITPLLSMAHRLSELDKGFELHLCAASEGDVPFRDALKNWSFAPSVELHLDQEAGRSSIDLERVLADPDPQTLIYVCGPAGFSRWVEERAQGMGYAKSQIKKELFAAEANAISEPKAFELELRKSGKTLRVESDQTIIDALEHENVKVPYSCMQGTCGTCVQSVLSGDVEHRDAVLSEEEKLSGEKICLCVSRSKGGPLSLDL